jgi:hypothetical protein
MKKLGETVAEIGTGVAVGSAIEEATESVVAGAVGGIAAGIGVKTVLSLLDDVDLNPFSGLDWF